MRRKKTKPTQKHRIAQVAKDLKDHQVSSQNLQVRRVNIKTEWSPSTSNDRPKDSVNSGHAPPTSRTPTGVHTTFVQIQTATTCLHCRNPSSCHNPKPPLRHRSAKHSTAATPLRSFSYFSSCSSQSRAPHVKKYICNLLNI